MNAEPIAAAAVEGGVEEGAQLRGSTRGAGERAIEEIEDAEEEDEDTRCDPGLRRGGRGTQARPDEADEGQRVRAETETTERAGNRGREAAYAVAHRR